MTEWLRDGLEGRSMKAALRLYLYGLILVAPAAAVTAVLFGTQASYTITPVLVVVLVGVQYAVYLRSTARRPRESGQSMLDDLPSFDSLIALLEESKDPWIQAKAMFDLADIGGSRAVDRLLNALSNEGPFLRFIAAESLGRIGDRRAVEPLVAALRDEDSRVAISCAGALWRIGGRRALDTLAKALRDESPSVGSPVMMALLGIDDPRARRFLDKLSYREDQPKGVLKRA